MTAMKLTLDGMTVGFDEGEFAAFPSPVYDNQPVDLLPCGAVAVGGLDYESNRFIWSPIVQTADLSKVEVLKWICHRAFQLASAGQNPAAVLEDLAYRVPVGGTLPNRRRVAGTTDLTVSGKLFRYCQFSVYPYNFREEPLGLSRIAAFQMRELAVLV